MIQVERLVAVSVKSLGIRQLISEHSELVFTLFFVSFNKHLFPNFSHLVLSPLLPMQYDTTNEVVPINRFFNQIISHAMRPLF